MHTFLFIPMKAANAKTLQKQDYVLPGERLIIPRRQRQQMKREEQERRRRRTIETRKSDNVASISPTYYEREQMSQAIGYPARSNELQQQLQLQQQQASSVARMPTIVTALSFVFGLAFGLFLFSRERE
jgi:hypothetical protein